jgi:hypothetical protein
VRQWPQMGEIVRTSRLVADVEGNFPELTLEVGRRLQLDDVVVVEWTCNYGDVRLYRNVTIGELQDGQAVRVTDYRGEPTATPEWRQPLTDRLDMPGDGIWPDNEHLGRRYFFQALDFHPSASPTAFKASARVVYASRRAIFPSRTVQTAATRPRTSRVLPSWRPQS